jgi:hypothetical protein
MVGLIALSCQAWNPTPIQSRHLQTKCNTTVNLTTTAREVTNLACVSSAK